MILEPLYYVSYDTLVWGDLGFINFVDNTRLSQNQMAPLNQGQINSLYGRDTSLIDLHFSVIDKYVFEDLFWKYRTKYDSFSLEWVHLHAN